MTLASTHVEREDLGRGRVRDTIHMRPIAYRRDGSLRRITSTLAASGDAEFPLGVDELCQFRVDPRIAGKSPLVHVGHGAEFLRIALLGANNVAGVVAGNTITFPNAWNGADLRYTIAGHRIQEEILLRAGHPQSFAFRIDSHAGFDPVTMTCGQLRILDPVLEPPAGSEKLPVALAWMVSQSAGRYVLTVTLPAGDWTGWTIDPTLTVESATVDGHVYGANAAYATARSTAAGLDTTSTTWRVGQLLFGGTYYGWRAFLRFDTSTIGAGVITQVTLQLTPTNDQSGTDFDVQIAKYNWSAQDPIAAGNQEAAYDGALAAAADDNIWRNTAGLVNNTTYTSGILSTAWVNVAGNTYYALRSSRDVGAIAPAAGEVVYFASSNHATAAYRPKLVVDYTLPGGLLMALQNHGLYAHRGGL